MFHPAAFLLIWIVFAGSVQLFSWPTVGVACLLLSVFARGSAGKFGVLMRRARWLLISLWIILAWGTPGEYVEIGSLGPTREGVEVANLHVARLLLLLFSLALLQSRLPPQAFMSALLFCLRPLMLLGVQVERSVARLGLVFDYMENAPPRGTWRHFLVTAGDVRSLEKIDIEVAPWRTRDSLILAAACTFNVLAVCLS